MVNGWIGISPQSHAFVFCVRSNSPLISLCLKIETFCVFVVVGDVQVEHFLGIKRRGGGGAMGPPASKKNKK